MKLPQIAILLLAPAALLAQRGRADTLRYHELRVEEGLLHLSAGDLRVDTKRDASVSIVIRGDTARAWYDSLDVISATPQRTLHPASAGALRRLFVLLLDVRGGTRTIAEPALPDTLRLVTDLSHQFDEFFPRLVPDSLRPGLAWRDTVLREDSASTGQRVSYRAYARYLVRADTMVGAERAVVIEVQQDVRLVTTGRAPGQALTAESLLEGHDDGSFIVSVTDRRMVAHEHTADLSGVLSYRGGVRPVSAPQIFRYTVTVRARPRERSP